MDHLDPVEALFARADAAKIPMSDICSKAGVAQSTPSRWKNDRNGANLTTLRTLNDALSALIAERPREAA
jgi:transcriptional regulator with XRE-family HTH domain